MGIHPLFGLPSMSQNVSYIILMHSRPHLLDMLPLFDLSLEVHNILHINY